MAAYPSYPLQLPVRNGSLLPGICFRNEQSRLNAFSSVSWVEIPSGFAGVLVQPSNPTVEQQSFLWVQTDSFGNAIQQFTFSSQYGGWVWPHPWPANDQRRVLFVGDLADIALIDGGDAAAITATTGSFWSLDNDFTDKIPTGAGTVPEGIDAAKFYPGTAYPPLRGVYIIGRSARQYFVP